MAGRLSDQLPVPEVTGMNVWLGWSNPDPPHHSPVVRSCTATDTPASENPEFDDADPVIDPVQLPP